MRFFASNLLFKGLDSFFCLAVRALIHKNDLVGRTYLGEERRHQKRTELFRVVFRRNNN